jgi:hypothetical protein
MPEFRIISNDEFWLGLYIKWFLVFMFVGPIVYGLVVLVTGGLEALSGVIDVVSSWSFGFVVPTLRVALPLLTVAVGVALVFRIRAVGKMFPSAFFALLICAVAVFSSLAMTLPMVDGFDDVKSLTDLTWVAGVMAILAGIVGGLVASVLYFNVATIPMFVAVLLFVVLGIAFATDDSTHYQITEAGALGWFILTTYVAGVAWRARATKVDVTAGQVQAA